MNDAHASQANTAAPTLAVRGLGQIMLQTSDIGRTVQFYKETLGFTESEEQMLSPGVTLSAGDASIYVTDGGTPHAISTSRSEFRVALIINGLRDAYQRAIGAGIPIVEEYAGGEHFGSFSIADPDGVVVDLWGAP
jgi:catechol 2,3-dioxygenase-like lactoylglutathione lyase family enzyme